VLIKNNNTDSGMFYKVCCLENKGMSDRDFWQIAYKVWKM